MKEALNPLQEFIDSLSAESYLSVSYLRLGQNLFITKTVKKLCRQYATQTNTWHLPWHKLMKTNANLTRDNPLGFAALGDPQLRTLYIHLDKTEATTTRAVTETIEAKQDIVTSQCLIWDEEMGEEHAAALRGRNNHYRGSARRHSAGPEDWQLVK